MAVLAVNQQEEETPTGLQVHQAVSPSGGPTVITVSQTPITKRKRQQKQHEFLARAAY